MIHKAIPAQDPNSVNMIQITPEQLRAIANKMESQVKNTLPNQNIVYSLTRNDILVYDPEITHTTMMKSMVEQAKKVSIENNTIAETTPAHAVV